MPTQPEDKTVNNHVLIFKGDGIAGEIANLLETHILAIFCNQSISESKELVLNPSGCMQIPIELGNWSLSYVNIFVGCVNFYELSNCEGATYRVNSSAKDNVDLTIVQKFVTLRSIRGCQRKWNAVGNSNLLLGLIVAACCLGLLSIIVMIVCRIKRPPTPVAI